MLSHCESPVTLTHAILGVSLVTACTPEPVRFPNWEPTSVSVPEVSDRETALRYLAESRQLWEREGAYVRAHNMAGDYFYVRAKEHPSRTVRFTVLTVAGGRPHSRILLESQLDDPASVISGTPSSGCSVPHYDCQSKKFPRILWFEGPDALGSHSEGATPLTLPELYGLCEQQLRDANVSAKPRLYFDRHGFLAHCGYLPSDCPSCSSIAIQSLGRLYEGPQKHIGPFCANRWGIWGGVSPEDPEARYCSCMRSESVLFGSSEFLKGEWRCFPINLGDESVKSWPCPVGLTEIGKATPTEPWKPVARCKNAHR